MSDTNEDNGTFISNHRLSSRWRRARDGVRPVGSAEKSKVATRFSLVIISVAVAVLVGSAAVSVDGNLRPLTDDRAGSSAPSLQEDRLLDQTDSAPGSLLSASVHNAGYATQLAAAATLKIGEGMGVLLKQTITESMEFSAGNLLRFGDLIVVDVPAYQPPQLLP